MYKLCVFAGTSEGRRLISFLAEQSVPATVCVATEYGEMLLPDGEQIMVREGRMTKSEIEAMLKKESFDLVVDATHPYAVLATENIAEACASAGAEYFHLLREDSDVGKDAVVVPDVQSAVAYLNERDGNILLTTGSKDLTAFADIRDFASRVFARVLPLGESLAACNAVGLQSSHIIAMQGPFSKEINTAMLRMANASFVVTKRSGSVGGFEEKIAAAKEVGVIPVIIDRPSQHQGRSYGEIVALLCEKFGISPKQKVSVAGIGPGSLQTMTAEVRNAIEHADCLIGATRMLRAVSRPDQALYDAISPDKIAEYISEHKEYHRFAVVMSGDTGFFSGTKKLLPLLKECEVTVLPGISSLSYLCSRLGTSYEDVVTLSLHGRDHNIMKDVRHHSRVFTLVGGENGIGRLCSLLTENGMGNAEVSVGERLSYPDEKITVGKARELAKQTFQSLSAALIEHNPLPKVVTHGLPDAAFQRGAGSDGVVPMTKSEVRSVALSKLELTEDAVCWDVGAGTGSVSIEMALQASRGKVYAVEQKEAALELLQENCKKFGVNNLTVVSGTAPKSCEELPGPDRVFIGGSSGNMKEILSLILAKNPRARIVATAIALESVAELTSCMKSFAFAETEVVALNVSKSRKAGSYHLMNGQNPIYIFTMQAEEN